MPASGPVVTAPMCPGAGEHIESVQLSLTHGLSAPVSARSCLFRNINIHFRRVGVLPSVPSDTNAHWRPATILSEAAAELVVA